MYFFSSVKALNKTCLRLSQNPATGNGGACFGDSGEPTFSDVNGVRTLVALVISGDSVRRSANVTYRTDSLSARSFLAPYVPLP